MDSDNHSRTCFPLLFARKRRTPPAPPSAPSLPAQFPPKSAKGDLQNEAKKSECATDVHCYSPCCDFSYGAATEFWTDSEQLPCYTSNSCPSMATSVVSIVETTINRFNPQLRQLSLQLHQHPEIRFEERFAHDLLSNFMETQGFVVIRHYLGLETAWRAEYTQGSGGRVVGINAEMDALVGMGHACGHNLIAISGVAVAIALKAALLSQPSQSGKVVLLGTPAEENGGGKVILLNKGAYNGMDVCIMCHPGPGPKQSASVGSTIAMQAINVEYFGQSAHAGAAPWEGTNALDAAFLAYSGVALLRQQMKPDHRVHGIVQGKNWEANVIPDYAKMRWLVRAPTTAELTAFSVRVKNCLQAAALATSCRCEIEEEIPYFDVHQNPVLAESFADITKVRYGLTTVNQGSTASTDFGNVSYALPALHPAFAIPTTPNGGNHTPAFAKAAISEAAHAATMCVSKGLALTGYRVLSDSQFCQKVRDSFDLQNPHRP